jgi:hypothetical protein
MCIVCMYVQYLYNFLFLQINVNTISSRKLKSGYKLDTDIFIIIETVYLSSSVTPAFMIVVHKN